MITTVKGQLEIDHDRGVIYFHNTKGITLLRICSLPKVPHLQAPIPIMLDVTHKYGTSWDLPNSPCKFIG